MPVNLPGTLFNKSMKARRELSQILARILSERRRNGSSHNDLLGSFMGDKEELTDEQIADNIIGVIFAARDTTASVMTWILKYLAENPNVLEAVTVSSYTDTYLSSFGNYYREISWARDAHWSMGGLSFTRLRLQGRIEGNVNKLRAQLEKSSPVKLESGGFEKKKKKRSGSESPPAAPVAVKRRRYLDLN